MPLSPLNRALRDFLEAGPDPASCEDCLRYLLSGRAKFQHRPDPTRWKTGDVRELLLDLAPTRLTENCDLSGHGVATLRAYLTFLDSSDHLHPASAGVPALLKELDRVAPLYPEAMADQSRFRLAKRLYTAMLADSVRIEDDVAVNAWLETFHGDSAERKHAVLGRLLEEKPGLATAWFVADEGVVAALDRRPASDPAKSDEAPADFPPVGLPDDATLAAEARSSSTMRRIWELAEWVAPRRTVTKEGELLPKDVRALADFLHLPAPSFLKGRLQFRDLPEVSHPFWLGLATEVLAIRRTGAVPGPRYDLWASIWGPGGSSGPLDGDQARLDAAVLETWEEVFQLIVEHSGGPVSRESMAERLQDWARNVTPKMIAALYAVEAGREAQDLIRGILTEVGATGRDDEDGIVLQQVLSGLLGGDLIDLEKHGAVWFSGPGLAEFTTERAALDAQGVEALAGMELAGAVGVTVQLTPLGTWALRRAFLSEGAGAPLLALSV